VHGHKCAIRFDLDIAVWRGLNGRDQSARATLKRGDETASAREWGSSVARKMPLR